MISLLYVDDGQELLGSVQRFLEQMGEFSVDTAGSGHQALAKIKAAAPDAVVSSYLLSDMNGIEFLTRLRHEYPNLPFILVIEKGIGEVVTEALEQGANLYLQTGGPPEVQARRLADIVQQAIKLHHSAEALKESEKKYRLLFENAVVGIFQTALDGRLMDANCAFARMYGYRDAGEIITAISDIGVQLYAHPGDRLEVLSALREKGFMNAREFPVRHRDGHIFWVSVTGRAVKNPDGTILWYEGTNVDVTDRRKAEQALQESEFRFHELFTRMSSGVAVYQPVDDAADFVLVDFNASGERIDHIGRDQVIGRRVTEVFPGIAEFGLLDVFRRVSRSGNPEHFEVSHYQDHRISGWRENFVYRLPTGEIVAIYDDITERKNAELAMQESEARYRSVIEHANEAMVIVTDEKLVYANPRALDMIQATPEELRLHPFTDFIHPDDREMVLERHRRRIQGLDAPSGYDFRVLGQRGKVTWVQIGAVRIPWEKRVATLNFLTDVTERRQMEKALHQSEEHYRLLADNANDMIWVADLGMRLTYISPSVLRILGFTAEEAMARTMVEAYTPASYETAMQHFLREMEIERSGKGDPGRSVMLELELYKKDGSVVPLEANFSFIRDPSGKPRAILTIAREISERRRAEEALIRSEALLKTTGKIARVGGWEIDTATRAVSWTEEIYHIHELPVGAVPSMEQAIRYFHPEEHAKLSGAIEKALSTGEGFDLELKFITATGRNLWTRIVGKPQLAGGNVVRLNGILQDITARKQAEEALRQANRKLNLLGAITRHDILNKVTIILGYLDLAGMKSRDPVTEEYLAKVKSATRAIQSQVEFTRVYQDLGIAEPMWHNIEKIVKGLRIPASVKMSSSVQGISVLADPMLEKVFSNLLDNSVRHGITVTDIRVSYTRSGDETIIAWEDNGVGVPAREKELIFDRGYGKNTGLGLFLAREILSITGISIRENGTEGEGARFEIVVPAVACRVT